MLDLHSAGGCNPGLQGQVGKFLKVLGVKSGVSGVWGGMKPQQGIQSILQSSHFLQVKLSLLSGVVL